MARSFPACRSLCLSNFRHSVPEVASPRSVLSPCWEGDTISRSAVFLPISASMRARNFSGSVPRPFGLGHHADDIARIIEEGKARNLTEKSRDLLPFDGHGGDRTPEKKPEKTEDRDQVDNVHLPDAVPTNQQNSNSHERIIRRLKRDAPAIAKKLEEGEYKSARQAAEPFL
jgi:hypothetical protein